MRKKIFALSLALSCVVCIFAGCGTLLRDDDAPAATLPTVETETTANATVSESEKAESDGVETLFRRMADSTLCIFTSTGSNGTGFLYGEKYLITNAHVLYDAESFTLLDRQGIERQGTVVFTDDGEDIAVIQLADYQGKSVTLGDSDALPVGERVLLISLPARILRNSVVNIVIAVANRAVIEAGLEPVFDARLHKLTANVAAAPAPIGMRDGKIVHLGIPKRKARCVLFDQHGVFCAEKRGASDPLLRIEP